MNLDSWKKMPIGGMITEPGNSIKNKTGDWKSQRPVVDHSKCTQCQTCIKLCPEKAIILNKKGEIEIDQDYCKGCGLCESGCPLQAIKMK